MMQEGYRSLAQRTLDAFYSLRSSIPRQMPEVERELNQYKQILEMVTLTGNIKEGGNTTRGNLNFMIDCFEQFIPAQLKPSNHELALAFATSAIRAYFGITSMEELLEKAQISKINVSSGMGGISLMGQMGDKTPQRVFFINYDPQMPAYSAIINIHELKHGLQPELEQTYQVLFGLSDIGGYSNFTNSFGRSPTLKKMMMDIAMESHQLNFLDTKEARTVAKIAGVDMDALDSFLKENIPVMDFLSCYQEGDAYLAQTDIIKAMPDLQGRGVYLQLYELFSLTDALIAPFQKPKEKVYEVGIGMVEYFRNNPSEAVELKKSRVFYEEVSKRLN